MEAEHHLFTHAVAASDEVASLHARLVEAEAEAIVPRARVERLERNELLFALLAATRPSDTDLHSSSVLKLYKN